MHAAVGVCLATLFVPADALAVSPNRILIELANAPEQQVHRPHPLTPPPLHNTPHPSPP